MRLLGCFCVFLSGFYCVPLVFLVCWRKMPHQRSFNHHSNQEDFSSPKKPVTSGLQEVCLILKLQVSNHLGWRVEVSTEAAGVGLVSTPVVEVPSEHKHYYSSSCGDSNFQRNLPSPLHVHPCTKNT